MGVTMEGLANLLAEIESMRPTLIVHPDDEQGVREAIDKLGWDTIAPRIEVTQLARPGQVYMFRGARWPAVNLGEV